MQRGCQFSGWINTCTIGQLPGIIMRRHLLLAETCHHDVAGPGYFTVTSSCLSLLSIDLHGLVH